MSFINNTILLQIITKLSQLYLPCATRDHHYHLSNQTSRLTFWIAQLTTACDTGQALLSSGLSQSRLNSEQQCLTEPGYSHSAEYDLQIV